MSLALPTPMPLVLADVWSRTRVADAVTVVSAAGLTALSAQVAFPVPGSPVPVTGQTLAVLLTAAALGPLRGALGQLLYVMAALVGLPVLAQGTGGAQAVFGATAGYLLGFIVAAAIVRAAGAVLRFASSRRTRWGRWSSTRSEPLCSRWSPGRTWSGRSKRASCRSLRVTRSRRCWPLGCCRWPGLGFAGSAARATEVSPCPDSTPALTQPQCGGR